MPLDGEKKRFTHATMVYEGGQLPEKYEGKMMALNPLHNYVQLSRMEKSGSSFTTIDENTLLETNDKWFRPVDIKTGPEGAVYIADWYDSRLSHVDPRDTWHKSSGRIYRMSKKGSTGISSEFNFSEMDHGSLIHCLSHPNKWYRQQALRQFADKKDPSALPLLYRFFEKGNDQEALEALWAINLSGGLNGDFASAALQHHDPFVRMWTIRLLADKNEVSPVISEALIHLAKVEKDKEVRSQLAASARRLPSTSALAIINNLNLHHDDSGDPDIPLQIWWALESKVDEDTGAILQIFRDRKNWMRPLVEKHLMDRLMQRLIMGEKYAEAEELLELAPERKHALLLVEGFYEGIGGQDLVHLPKSLVNAIQTYSDDYSSLALSLRSGDRRDLETAKKILKDENEATGKQLALIHLFGEIQEPAIVPVLMEIATASKSTTSIKQASLNALTAYPSSEIGEKLALAYPNIRADEYVREAAIRLFASRKDWAKAFLSEITDSKIIHKEDVPYELARNFYLLEDESISQKAGQLWPSTLPLTAESKTEEFKEVKELILSGSGDAVKGKSLFMLHCGKCHRLENAGGGTIGPDLTGYDRSQVDYWLLHTIDPNADIREGYETVEVVTTNDRMIMGKLEKENGGTLQLSDPFGARGITIPNSQVKSLKISNLSLMPEGILRKMEEGEIRDLFAYLLK
jgi:putative heme-binding domain-containing protein